jgi:hypothetical protein
MIYDIYAMFTEGSYLVVSSNDAEHGADLADRVCKELNQWPMAFATLTRGEHVIRGEIFTVQDLKRRG